MKGGRDEGGREGGVCFCSLKFLIVVIKETVVFDVKSQDSSGNI